MYVVYFDSDVIKNCFVPSSYYRRIEFFFLFFREKTAISRYQKFRGYVKRYKLYDHRYNVKFTCSIINCDEKCDDEFEWPSTHFWHLKLKQFEYSSKYYFYVGNSSRFYSLNKFFLKSFHMLDSIIFENRFFVWRKRDKVSHEKKVSMINTPFQSFRKYL